MPPTHPIKTEPERVGASRPPPHRHRHRELEVVEEEEANPHDPALDLFVYVVDDHVIDLMELRSLALVIPIPDTLNNLTLNLKVMLFAHSATATTEKSDCCQTRNDSVRHHGLYHLDQI